MSRYRELSAAEMNPAQKRVHDQIVAGKRGLAVGLVELADEMIEGIQVDAAHGDSGGADHEQFAPNFFFGAVQAHNDNRMRIHG